MASQSEQNQQASAKGESIYPLYGLPEALRFAEAVNALGGARSDVDRSMLASQLGLDEKSSSLSQRMGAAKSYGIITGRGSYCLTRLGVQYFLPTSESDKQQALLAFLGSPSAFMVLIKRFDGSKLPPAPMLGNILQKEAGVPPSWKERVAQIFLKSARSIGVIDGNGFLRVRSAIQGLQIKGDAPAGEQAKEPMAEPMIPIGVPATEPRIPSSLGPSDSNLWNYSFGGMNVRVETPKNLELGLWEKLNGYVQLLKPTNGANS